MYWKYLRVHSGLYIASNWYALLYQYCLWSLEDTVTISLSGNNYLLCFSLFYSLQCDQIWWNFANLAKVYKYYLANFWQFISYLAKCRAHFGKFVSLLGLFSLLEIAKHWKKSNHLVTLILSCCLYYSCLSIWLSFRPFVLSILFWVWHKKTKKWWNVSIKYLLFQQKELARRQKQ